MAVTATGSAADGSGSTSSTWSHTNPSDGDFLFVGFHGRIVAAEAATVTYNAVSMTRAIARQHTLDSNMWMMIYGLVAPATGAHNVVIADANGEVLDGISQSFTGVNQSTPTGNTGGVEVPGDSLTSDQLNIASAAGAGILVVDFMGITNSNTAAQLSATGTNALVHRIQHSYTSGISSQAGAALCNFEWTWINLDYGENVGVELIPAGYIKPGGGAADDRFRFRNSQVVSYTSTRSCTRAAWPDDALDGGWRDSVTDDNSRSI